MSNLLLPPLYSLVAQSNDGVLTLSIRDQKCCLCRTAAEIVAAPPIMQNLSPFDRELVKAIAAHTAATEELQTS